MGFKDRLREAREAQGKSQADIARISGLTCAAICQIENGKREPSLSSILKLQKALRNISLDYLVKGDDMPLDYKTLNLEGAIAVPLRLKELDEDSYRENTALGNMLLEAWEKQRDKKILLFGKKYEVKKISR